MKRRSHSHGLVGRRLLLGSAKKRFYGNKLECSIAFILIISLAG
jgi:hypothetical protein